MAASEMQNNRKVGTPVLFATLFIGIIAILTLSNYITRSVFLYYIGINIITFLFYVYDKTAAQSDMWRIKEDTLHLLSISGGWAGALIAQDIFRHKTQKKAFRTTFYMTVFINCLVSGIGFIYIHNPNIITDIQNL